MKRIVETTDAGLESVLGETVLFLCMNYFYVGTLVGVNKDHVELSNAKLVYETGPWKERGFKDAQALPFDTFRVQIDAIESWGVVDEG